MTLKGRLSDNIGRQCGRIASEAGLRAITCSLMLLAVEGVAFGQATAAARLKFEVASVKVSSSLSPEASMHFPPGRVVMNNVTLRECVRSAFGVPDARLRCPGWAADIRLVINAKLPSGTTSVQYKPALLQLLLQALLEERFGLRSHNEEERVNGYSLGIGPHGSKCEPEVTDGPPSSSVGVGVLNGRHMTMPQFAEILSGILSEPVTDETGLEGAFHMRLVWTPDAHPQNGVDGTNERPSLELPGGTPPSVSTAIQDQLGLKLKHQKITVLVRVVDTLARVPTEN